MYKSNKYKELVRTPQKHTKASVYKYDLNCSVHFCGLHKFISLLQQADSLCVLLGSAQGSQRLKPLALLDQGL